MNRIRSGAKIRNIVFDLSYEYLTKFFKACCYYCGDKVPILSLDRVDSSIGYTESNVVSCCFLCNRMKLVSTKDEFIKRCKAIARRF